MAKIAESVSKGRRAATATASPAHARSPRSLKSTPAFTSEAEERAFWVPHPGAIIAVRRQSQTIFLKVGLF